MHKQFDTKRKGFALAEMVVYVVILTLMILTLTGSIQAFISTYKHVRVGKNIETSALTALDRITREIKNGEQITMGSSAFNATSSYITIEGLSPTESSKTTYIYVQNGVLKINENGVYKGQLTSSSTEVTNFTLRLIDQSISDAVKIELTLQGGSGTYEQEQTFYTTALLRGSY